MVRALYSEDFARSVFSLLETPIGFFPVAAAARARGGVAAVYLWPGVWAVLSPRTFKTTTPGNYAFFASLLALPGDMHLCLYASFNVNCRFDLEIPRGRGSLGCRCFEWQNTHSNWVLTCGQWWLIAWTAEVQI